MPESGIPNTFEDKLYYLADEIRTTMISLGGDPENETEVESFVNGCGIAKKLKKLICDMDPE